MITARGEDRPVSRFEWERMTTDQAVPACGDLLRINAIVRRGNARAEGREATIEFGSSRSIAKRIASGRELGRLS